MPGDGLGTFVAPRRLIVSGSSRLKHRLSDRLQLSGLADMLISERNGRVFVRNLVESRHATVVTVSSGGGGWQTNYESEEAS